MKNRRQRPDAAQRSFRLWLCVWMFVILSITIAIFSSVTVVFEETELVHGLTDGNWLPFIFSAVASLLIGTLLTPLILRIPLKPINNLINQMNRLAAGDFRARLSFGSTLSSHPAFKEMIESFNKMAEELENTEMLRNDFINNFSHEFKTPIVSIAGFAKLLARGNLTEEEKAVYLRSIEEESMRLSAMATNVLKLTNVENHKILTDVTSFNLSEQLRDAILLLEAKWEEKNIDLQPDFEEYTVEANEELLKEVWINLIDNAVKFVPRCGTVTVRVEELEEILCVRIANTGSEIPEQVREKIFHKFYQADESHATGGNGIGLAIVKRVVSLHSGEVTVNCEDGWTTFAVYLPKKQNA